jgi:hypothetical protein
MNQISMAKKLSPHRVSTPETSAEITRVTLDLSASGYARLQRLAKLAGVSSAAVLRSALQLYEFVIEKRAEGATFNTIAKDGSVTQIRLLGGD